MNFALAVLNRSLSTLGFSTTVAVNVEGEEFIQLKQAVYSNARQTLHSAMATLEPFDGSSVNVALSLDPTAGGIRTVLTLSPSLRKQIRIQGGAPELLADLQNQIKSKLAPLVQLTSIPISTTYHSFGVQTDTAPLPLRPYTLSRDLCAKVEHHYTDLDHGVLRIYTERRPRRERVYPAHPNGIMFIPKCGNNYHLAAEALEPRIPLGWKLSIEFFLRSPDYAWSESLRDQAYSLGVILTLNEVMELLEALIRDNFEVYATAPTNVSGTKPLRPRKALSPGSVVPPYIPLASLPSAPVSSTTVSGSSSKAGSSKNPAGEFMGPGWENNNVFQNSQRLGSRANPAGEGEVIDLDADESQ